MELKNDLQENSEKLVLPDEALRLGAASIVMWLAEGNVMAALQMDRSMCSAEDLLKVKAQRANNNKSE